MKRDKIGTLNFIANIVEHLGNTMRSWLHEKNYTIKNNTEINIKEL